ncbi:MAG: PIN domain-containing protein [Armatimonadota bacterium]
MSNRSDIAGYSFTSSDMLLLDTNIWLLLFGPYFDPDDRRTKIYSQAFQSILHVKSTICLNALVISEYVNSFARLEHRRLRPAENFKAFRNSSDFIPVAQAIANTLQRICKRARCFDDGFATMDLPAMLALYEGGSTDINDQMIAQLCRAQHLTLITDDADYKALDVTLLTANQKLLR